MCLFEQIVNSSNLRGSFGEQGRRKLGINRAARAVSWNNGNFEHPVFLPASSLQEEIYHWNINRMVPVKLLLFLKSD